MLVHSPGRFRPILGLTFVLAAALGPVAPAARAQQAPAGGLGLLEAVRLTLVRDPNIALQEVRVESSRGFLEIVSSPFDPVVAASGTWTEVDVPTSESTSSRQQLVRNTVSVVKPFRTGLSIEPGVVLNREVASGDPGANTGNFFFRFRQPLLRGRGREAVAAGELSAERELAASELDLRQATAGRVLAVASQYWSARAAQLDLEVLISSQESSRELLETTRRLVEADQTPAAELVQLEANLAAKESSRIGGERRLFAAKQDLGREIGLDPAEISALSLPSDPFPVVRPEEVPGGAEVDRLVAVALSRRADLRAARERQSGADLLIRAAENGLKPQLDLIFTPSYTGFVQGTDAGSFFTPLGLNVPGVSSLLSLSLSWPTLNSLARGELLQAQAARRQSALVVDLVAKGIGADVPTALDSVRRSALQLAKATEAVGLFERAVVNEEKKLRAGTSTFINLISQRDRLTLARQLEVSAELALALSLVELRFQTGTLLGEDGGAASLQQDRLTALPPWEEP